MLALLMLVAVLTVGCAPTNAVSSPEPSTPAISAPRTQSQGQQLPISAQTTLGGSPIYLEVAATPQQQSLGLMFRPPLPEDRGMLFPFEPPRPVSFWMRNVPVPLDMVFIYQGQVHSIAAEVPPCEAAPCPTYGPGSQPIDAVIELRAGRAQELGIAVGDAVEIRPLDAPPDAD